ncbi:hypothetical protein [Aporhodopirellula aestuarii]|uniref:Uncharacterized protein n=1 Tax=Aporhodopirellula aestuarii TaxID=2950107 RepID=A0ABT0TYJ7_9BACT|nr:hypothetical protein [Aporhodopirellula aestuarii]MCM2369674.1 hypothetical protein [Aporhodopirellula aestuarii]
MMSFVSLNRHVLAVFMLAVGLTFAGCENKETILEIDTPDGGVEVERDRDTGAVSVDVDE